MNRQEFIKKIYSKNYLEKMCKKIKLLGNTNNLDVYSLLMFRLITSVIIFLICLYSYKYGYIVAPVATVIYYFVFQDLVIDSKIKKRTMVLEKEAMHFFEVLTLSLETGRNLESVPNNQTLRKYIAHFLLLCILKHLSTKNLKT